MIPIGSHVQARWSNGQFYGGVVIQGDGYQYMIQWDDGSAPQWVSAGDVMADAAMGKAMGAPMMGQPMMGQAMGGAAPVGSHVQARWTNGQFYGATVTQFNGAQYLVQWDDGSSPLWVAAHDVMPDGKMGGMGMGGGMSPGEMMGGAMMGGGMMGKPMMGKPMMGGGMSPGEMMGGAMMGGGMMGGPQVGSHVQARWSNGQFYGGTVVQNNGQACMIQWDDGSSPLWVAAHDIMADGGGMAAAKMAVGAAANYGFGGGAIQPGEHIQAQDPNDGRYVPGIVVQAGSGQYMIQWDDGSGTDWVPANYVMRG